MRDHPTSETPGSGSPVVERRPRGRPKAPSIPTKIHLVNHWIRTGYLHLHYVSIEGGTWRLVTSRNRKCGTDLCLFQPMHFKRDGRWA